MPKLIYIHNGNFSVIETIVSYIDLRFTDKVFFYSSILVVASCCVIFYAWNASPAEQRKHRQH